MAVEFKLPDLGEGITEGEIIEVLVHEGDRVEDGQTVLIIETDKATAEVPSPVTGTVKEIRVKPGQKVNVGEVLIVFLKEGEGEEAPVSPPQVGKVERKAAGEKTLEPRDTDKEEVPFRPSGGPVAAAPSTRRLARELGVDISQVKPSGPGGRVTPEDVRAFSERLKEPEAGLIPEAPKPAPREEAEERLPGLKPSAAGREGEPVKAPSPAEFERADRIDRMPLRSVRRTTAKHIALAWSQIPHVTHTDTADITELEAFRRRHKDEVQARGGVLSLTVLALKAAAAALRKYPFFNSSIDMDSEEIILKHYYNIGFAVDTGRGLLVPVIRDVDRKSLMDLAIEFGELTEKTRQGKATRDDLSGGTFTITNIGPIGGTGIAPIINYPEVAILGMARARLQPTVTGNEENFEIVPRLILPLGITFDHRVIDGAEAARFLSMIIDGLQDPEQLLMMS
jgi:pyruvate dehydrogenase E2 component (dihydrolipoamide acetyltransferase)